MLLCIAGGHSASPKNEVAGIAGIYVVSDPELRLILTQASDPESRGSGVRSRMKALILDRTSDPE